MSEGLTICSYCNDPFPLGNLAVHATAGITIRITKTNLRNIIDTIG